MSLAWTLIPVSAIYGVVAALVFRRFTDASAIRREANQALAHTMELGLFFDSPALVFQAHRDLLKANIRLLRLILVPCAILCLAFTALYKPLDAICGRAPLAAGEASVVTVRLKDASTHRVDLEPPPGIQVETPGVRVPRASEISWRVRPVKPVSGSMKFRLDGRLVDSGAFQEIEIPYPPAEILGFSWLFWFAVLSAISAALWWKR